MQICLVKTVKELTDKKIKGEINMKERLEILRQLENSEISPEEAQRKLKALKEASKPTLNKGKTFKIQIHSGDGDVVNVQVPLNLARMLLKGKKPFMGDFDINFEEVVDILDSGSIGEIVNIESADGDRVKIVVE